MNKISHSRVPALALFTIVACGGHTQDPAGPRACNAFAGIYSEPPAEVIDSCPTEQEPSTTKIVDPGGLFDRTQDKAHRAAVKLRPSLETVPKCSGRDAPDFTCPERDAALLMRQHANVTRLACVRRALGARSEATPFSALWYEVPNRLSTSNVPVPIGLEFAVTLSVPEIEKLAAHPYVERIAPAPGLTPMASAGSDCPDASRPDEPLPKLSEAQEIMGRGRAPVVIDLANDVLLPAESDTSEACNGPLVAAWERTILNTRQMTCLKRWVSAHLQTETHEVSYGAQNLALDQPPLPPFVQLSSVSNAIALELTWEEALAIAPHPFVKKIWTSQSLQSADDPTRCAGSQRPVAPHACPTAREAPNMKWSDGDRSYWEANQGSHNVMVTIRGGAKVCSLPLCSGSATTCPERQRVIDHWTAENTEAQHCVRESIVSLGGLSEPQVMWLVNSIHAYLTWQQILEIAGHPDVEQIVRVSSGVPKPKL